MSRTGFEGPGRFSYHYPRLVVMVTSHVAGQDGVMTAAWHAPVSLRPPLYGISISPTRHTYDLILQGGEFGVNFLPFERAELLAGVGGTKGKEVDKFDRFGIAKEKALRTSVPLLEDAYAAYECRLADHRSYGDHVWVIGEVVATHIVEEAFDEYGVLDVARFSPALYLGGENYVTALKDSVRYLDRRAYGRY